MMRTRVRKPAGALVARLGHAHWEPVGRDRKHPPDGTCRSGTTVASFSGRIARPCGRGFPLRDTGGSGRRARSWRRRRRCRRSRRAGCGAALHHHSAFAPGSTTNSSAGRVALDVGVKRRREGHSQCDDRDAMPPTTGCSASGRKEAIPVAMTRRGRRYRGWTWSPTAHATGTAGRTARPRVRASSARTPQRDAPLCGGDQRRGHPRTRPSPGRRRHGACQCRAIPEPSRRALRPERWDLQEIRQELPARQRWRVASIPETIAPPLGAKIKGSADDRDDDSADDGQGSDRSERRPRRRANTTAKPAYIAASARAPAPMTAPKSASDARRICRRPCSQSPRRARSRRSPRKAEPTPKDWSRRKTKGSRGTLVATIEITRAGRVHRGSAQKTAVSSPTANAELNSRIAMTDVDTFGLAKMDMVA